MKALLINGSPHEAGCTYTALAEVEKALAAPNGGKKILESMAALRKLVDMLEKRVDDDLWTLPKYREMLFIN